MTFTKMKLDAAGVLVIMMVGVAVGQRMLDVCKDMPDDQSHAAQRPRISNQFHVDVECKLAEKNMTVYVKEYYDLQRNRGRLTVEKTVATKDFFMDYDSNMVLMVIPETGTCTTGMLMLSGDRFIFGYRMEDYNSQIFSPSGALHFSNANETYNGTTAVRGILVDEWHSCQYLAAINATAHVTWYFSRKTTWDMQLGTAVVPVRMMAVGKQVMPNNTVKPFSHIYDFFNFEPNVDPYHFEVPNGIYCTDRGVLGKPKAFPQIPDNFVFVGEINNPQTNVFTFIEEAYDNNTKYAMYKFKTNPTQLKNGNQYTELNDYNTGVSYLIDNLSGGCQWSAVKDSAMAFYKNVNSQQVRMETPREFFMDSNINYQYAGSRLVRNIPCERWVGRTNQARGYSGTNVTVEWYFAAEDHESWIDDVDTAVIKYRIPIQLRVFLPVGPATDSYEFNIFNYNVNNPYLSEVDTSQCFKGTTRKSFRFSIPKSSESLVRHNLLQTALAIQTSISDMTRISRLRVTDIQPYFNPTNVWITFDMLERPTHYDDVVSGDKQSSLLTAIGLLRSAFSQHTLVFFVPNGLNIAQLRPDYNSLVDISVTTPSKGGHVTTRPGGTGTGGTGTGGTGTGGTGTGGTGTGGTGTGGTGTGGTGTGGTGTGGTGTGGTASGQQQPGGSGGSDLYSGGAMAGLGIAMLIIGGAGGATGAFFFFK